MNSPQLSEVVFLSEQVPIGRPVPVRGQLSQWDRALLLLLFVAGIVPVISALHAAVAPKEDALMLLRYSEHLAQGYGIR